VIAMPFARRRASICFELELAEVLDSFTRSVFKKLCGFRPAARANPAIAPMSSRIVAVQRLTGSGRVLIAQLPRRIARLILDE
jgi:hypothetical protein